MLRILKICDNFILKSKAARSPQWAHLGFKSIGIAFVLLYNNETR